MDSMNSLQPGFCFLIRTSCSLLQLICRLEDVDFLRRMATEKDMISSDSTPQGNAIFDASGHFVIYPTILGIKIVSLINDKVVRILGNSSATTPEVYCMTYFFLCLKAFVLDIRASTTSKESILIYIW